MPPTTDQLRGLTSPAAAFSGVHPDDPPEYVVVMTMARGVLDMRAHLERIEAELGASRRVTAAANEEIRGANQRWRALLALHRPDDTDQRCRHDGKRYPCKTRRVLTGTTS